MHRLNHIMLVEDEPDIQTVARLALETVGGFQVSVCGNGAQALEEVVKGQPDLILLDVMMPGMDGPTTLQALREMPEAKKTPVIFMTAKVQKSEIEEYQERGAIGVIAKPFDPMKLADQVREIWSNQNV